MQFALLGPLTISDRSGAPVELAGSRLRVLLAALLLHADMPVAADALAEAVWDGMPPGGSAVTMRSYVMRLRRALGPEAGGWINAREPGYVIRLEATALDVRRFETLSEEAADARRSGAWAQASSTATRGLGLWRAEPLLDVPSQVLRDQFVPRLERIHVQLLEDYAEAELQLGRHEHLLPRLSELTARHPLRERFRAQLMMALARTGRQAEALATYQDAWDALADQLGVEPGPELRQLHRRILGGDPGLLGPVRAEGVRAPGLAVVSGPRQLPTAAMHFTGRLGEIEELTGLLDLMSAAVGAVPVSAIDGMAGIGKTALAITVAHRLAGQFPDGQLFIDLHGYTRGHEPRLPGEALSWFLRAMGVSPRQIPDDTEERAALYRQRLSDTRTLIVLDNAASEAQVRPLLPGTPGCLVFITSRRRLRGLADAHNLSLEVLPQADAVELFRTVAGPQRAPAGNSALAEIAELCGRLPLALRMAAALLRHRSGWSLEYLAGQLRDHRRRVSGLSDGETELDAVFDLSYRILTPRQRDLFRRLGLIPGPDVDAYAAAAITGTDAGTAGELLEDLTDHNMLIQHVPGRYVLHDLLRLHASGRAALDPPGRRDADLDRLRDYYQVTAGRAEARIAPYSGLTTPGDLAAGRGPSFPSHDAALAWLRTERANILACLRDVALATCDTRVIALTRGLASLLRTDGPWAEAMTLHAGAATAAGRRGDRHAQATALTHLGAIRRLTGDLPGAARDLREALESYRHLGDRPGQAAALTELGTVQELTGEHASAARDLREALESYRHLGDGRGQATALTLLGEVLRVTCDFPAATRNLEEALGLYRESGDQEGQTDALIRLGDVRRMTGDYAGAARDQEAALRISLILGDRQGQAAALTALGDVRRLKGEYRGAARSLEQALGLYRDLGSRNGRASVLTLLGAVQGAAGDLSAAGQSLTEALDVFRAAGAQGSEAWALNYYAAVHAAAGAHAQALARYSEALALAREVQQPDEEAFALEGIGECRLRAGAAAAGIAHLEQALDIFQRLSATPDAERIRRRLAELAAPE